MVGVQQPRLNELGFVTEVEFSRVGRGGHRDVDISGLRRAAIWQSCRGRRAS